MPRRASISREGLLEYLKEVCQQNGGSVKASVKELTQWIGGSTPTVSKYLSQLVDDGYITVKRGKPASYSVSDVPVRKSTTSQDNASSKKLESLLSELAPLVGELTTVMEAIEENKELRAFKASLTLVYEDDGMVLYRQAKPQLKLAETYGVVEEVI